MQTTEAQRLVAQAITDRGYDNGWSHVQLMARQVAKMQEELGELLFCFTSLPGIFRTTVEDAEAAARDAFDKPRYWDFVGLRTSEATARLELTDVAVTVLKLAELLGFDVVEAAIAKAQADVVRGIRGSPKDPDIAP